VTGVIGPGVLNGAAFYFHLPLEFRSISDPFVKQWILTAYGSLGHSTILKRHLLNCFGTVHVRDTVLGVPYRYDCRSGETFSEHYIRYVTMASMLSPPMSDQDLLGAMVTHYGPKIEACLVSANVKSNQVALAVLTKLQSL